MGWFGPTIKYSTTEHQLSEFDIKKFVSHGKVMTLSPADESLIEKAIVARRHGDGKISLQQIYETLLQLFNQRRISKQDKEGVMKVFESYFIEHFKL